VRLDPVVGSEQAGDRPALIISPDLINQHSPVVLLAALTSQKTDRVFPLKL
jgi:mRNA interferase MazF